MLRNAKIGVLLIGLCTSALSAQIQIGPPIKLPISGCPDDCVPADPDPCCDAGPLTCTRVDFGPYFESFGTEVQIKHRIECEHCLENCPCCPVLSAPEDCARCWEIAPRDCGPYDIPLLFIETVNVDLSNLLQVSLSQAQVAAMKGLLSSVVGAIDGRLFEFTADCGFEPIYPCSSGVWSEPFIAYNMDRKVRIDHEWYSSGIWIKSCAPQFCPTDGMNWETQCNSDSSIATAKKYDRQSCGVINYEIPCGD